MNWTNIAIIVFLLYWIFVIKLDKQGFLKKHNITNYGPILMIRTTKGLTLLDKLAIPKKGWRLFANFGIILMFIGMIAMFLIVLYSDLSLLKSFANNTVPAPNKFNEARNIFLIPGVNEFIPFTWGLIALIVTLVVHEFSHAILCRVENIRVKSMGILLALLPIGGFAEPDENELFENEDNKNLPAYEESNRNTQKVATNAQRSRILAAGVMANFVIALIAFSLFFGPVLGSIAPVGNIMVVKSSNTNIQPNMIITQIDDKPIDSIAHLMGYLDNLPSGKTVKIHATNNEIASIYDLNLNSTDSIDGVLVQNVVSQSPAENVGLTKGMMIMKMNNMSIRNIYDFRTFMNISYAGQSVDLLLKNNGSTLNKTVQLVEYPDKSIKKGYLGVYTAQNTTVATRLGITVTEFPASTYLSLLKSIPSMLTNKIGWLLLMSLPITGFTGEGFSGFTGTLANFYEPVGLLSPLGIGAFWIANALLWIGWLNFYVGLFNCLPAVPLDGGHVFRGYTESAIYKMTHDRVKSKKLSAMITSGLALLIFVSFIFMIIGPYLVHGI